MKSVAAALFGALALPLAGHAQTAPNCEVPLDVVRLALPLPHVAAKIASGGPIKIVAIGSSSTAGAGASTPTLNYPSQLQAELRKHFPRQDITVLNRGVNGEEAKDMLLRFDTAVIPERPDLVLWQLGTNSVIRDHPLLDHGAQIRDGVEQMRRIGADVILIDPQYAPKVLAKGEAEHMVELIAVTAKVENVDLFRRWDLMRRWRDVDQMAFETFVSPDGLHMNDWSYGCIAKSMAAAIIEAASRPVASASASMPPILPEP